jgi:hypothetical protein
MKQTSPRLKKFTIVWLQLGILTLAVAFYASKDIGLIYIIGLFTLSLALSIWNCIKDK